MPLSQSDRISFSLAIVQGPGQIAGLQTANQQLNNQITAIQALDSANANLAIPSTTRINLYQPEISAISGTRSTVTEQDIQNAANKTLRNFFFPNDPNTSVPSLASVGNVWTKTVPYALNYAIGKNYSESYDNLANSEDSLNAQIQSFDMSTPPGTVTAAINAYIATLNAELAAIVTNDPDPAIQAQNNAAKTNINTTILPALNAFSDLGTLQAACVTRETFLNVTRKPQIAAILGTISQDISSGAVTGSGLYFSRYNFLSLRLNILGGSLINLANLQSGAQAQLQIISSIQSTINTYKSFIPTTSLQAPANGTNMIAVNDTSFLNQGDVVYVFAEGQDELLRAVKSINGSTVTLNDVVPAKYRTEQNARLYKDLT